MLYNVHTKINLIKKKELIIRKSWLPYNEVTGCPTDTKTARIILIYTNQQYYVRVY